MAFLELNENASNPYNDFSDGCIKNKTVLLRSPIEVSVPHKNEGEKHYVNTIGKHVQQFLVPWDYEISQAFEPFRKWAYTQQKKYDEKFKVTDRRVLQIQKRTDCDFIIDGCEKPKDILEILHKPPLQRYNGIPHRKVTIVANATEKIVQALGLLEDYFPYLMGRAKISKSVEWSGTRRWSTYDSYKVSCRPVTDDRLPNENMVSRYHSQQAWRHKQSSNSSSVARNKSNSKENDLIETLCEMFVDKMNQRNQMLLACKQQRNDRYQDEVEEGEGENLLDAEGIEQFENTGQLKEYEIKQIVDTGRMDSEQQRFSASGEVVEQSEKVAVIREQQERLNIMRKIREMETSMDFLETDMENQYNTTPHANEKGTEDNESNASIQSILSPLKELTKSCLTELENIMLNNLVNDVVNESLEDQILTEQLAANINQSFQSESLSSITDMSNPSLLEALKLSGSEIQRGSQDLTISSDDRSIGSFVERSEESIRRAVDEAVRNAEIAVNMAEALTSSETFQSSNKKEDNNDIIEAVLKAEKAIETAETFIRHVERKSLQSELLKTDYQKQVEDCKDGLKSKLTPFVNIAVILKKKSKRLNQVIKSKAREIHRFVGFSMRQPSGIPRIKSWSPRPNLTEISQSEVLNTKDEESSDYLDFISNKNTGYSISSQCHPFPWSMETLDDSFPSLNDVSAPQEQIQLPLPSIIRNVGDNSQQNHRHRRLHFRFD